MIEEKWKEQEAVTGSTMITVDELVDGMAQTVKFAKLYFEALSEEADGKSVEEIYDMHDGDETEKFLNKYFDSNFFRVFTYLLAERTDFMTLVTEAAGYGYLIEAAQKKVGHE